MKRAALLLLVLGALLALAAPAAGQSNCTFTLGFATFHDLITDNVGDCVESEGHNPQNGDGIQHTTGGLLVWRKADNWTAFTDGWETWINGPDGLQQRLNTERFCWEPDVAPGCSGDIGTLASAPEPAAAQPATPPSPPPAEPAAPRHAAPTLITPPPGVGASINFDLIGAPRELPCYDTVHLRLEWRWKGQLRPDEVFDVQVRTWNDPNWRGITWARQEGYQGNDLWRYQAIVPFPGGGPQVWRVAVIQVNDDLHKVVSELSPWSAEGDFNVTCP